MQAIFDESLVFSFQEVVKEAVSEVMAGKGMPAFQQALRNGLNRICCTIQQRVLELIDQELRDNLPLRKGWVIVRRDPKTILSPFGEVHYERTLFRNKKSGQHAHLADRLVGYKPHQRLDTLLEADLLEEAVDRSYAKAGKSFETHTGIRVSGQTVLNIVRKLQPEKIELKERIKVKKVASILYVEADEDHVPHREKGVSAFEQRLVYVHEGRVRVGKDRYELIGKKYFTFPPGTASQVIWEPFGAILRPLTISNRRNTSSFPVMGFLGSRLEPSTFMVHTMYLTGFICGVPFSGQQVPTKKRGKPCLELY
jgi:hypothetical protein